jgi:hypothetical protein
LHRLDRTSLRLAHLLDHLVGAGKQRRRHFEAERPRGFEINYQFERGWLLNGKIGRLGALENLVNVARQRRKAESRTLTRIDPAIREKREAEAPASQRTGRVIQRILASWSFRSGQVSLMLH